MKFSIYFFLNFFVFYIKAQIGNFTDERDGLIYHTVLIGSQNWMSENLNVSIFRNGDPVLEVKTDEEWKSACANKQPAWCNYNYEPKNGAKYGKLYNWFAVNDPRGLAPLGWHIPSNEEWNLIRDSLQRGSNSYDAAWNKMKSIGEWEPDNYGIVSNSSGFSALPGGGRNDGTFFSIGECGFWWSSDVIDIESEYPRAWIHYIGPCIQSYGEASALLYEDGYSVRCIHD
jgi:uncharacterized protein (TIGR02145 family)